MFQFEEDYILRNEITELSPLKEVHEADLFEESNHNSIWEHFTEKGLGEKNFSNYIKNAIVRRNQGKEYPFVIKDLRTNEIAGTTRLYQLDMELKNVKLGFTWIGARFQGTGLNKACKYLLFEFLFEKVKLERIGFGVSSLNERSINALLKVGCKLEGELRSFLPRPDLDKRVGLVQLSILKDEWLTNAKDDLKKAISAYS